jgi:hypothetical protein
MNLNGCNSHSNDSPSLLNCPRFSRINRVEVGVELKVTVDTGRFTSVQK